MDKKNNKIHIVNEEDEEVRFLDEHDKLVVNNDKITVVDKFSKTNLEEHGDVDQKINDIEDKEEIDDIQLIDESDSSDLIDAAKNLNKSENDVKNIIFEEFSRLIETIEKDFIKNYKRKRYNFLLSQFDELVTATMVFVSSFESKSGNAIERVAERVARLKFGEENVPSIINPRGIKHNIDPYSVEGQIIVTDINLDDGKLKGEISTFRASNVAKGKGKNRVKSGVNQESIKTLLQVGQDFKQINEVYTKPVDLAFFDGENWNLLELKAGGQLDSSNAPSNVEKLLSIYTGVNYENTKIYFATLYNKDGEGNTWSGSPKKHMAYPEMFLIGKNLWDKILPNDISFEKFTELYQIAMEEIDLNERIKEMIRKGIE
ncbi:TdeIII family type II restriction endonuclease [Aerococcus urinaeequi]|uniref:TdeIII family type II restriction endonuclease n=2 Tax=Aerococcus urinaeequi TaxID=51665 RepID=A0A7M1KV01_9LACT|nr:TdeIII family type II restriction endonuclease [Aerococcus urinaeequi]